MNECMNKQKVKSKEQMNETKGQTNKRGNHWTN